MNGYHSPKADDRLETYTEQFDWSADDEPSVAVVEAVANFQGCSETDLERLDEVIDTDALDALFSPRYSGKSRGRGHVSFSYSGDEVTVFSDGAVVVNSAPGAGAPIQL